MNESTPLVFFGTEDFSARSLAALVDDGWPVSAVITKPDTKSGRGQKLTEPKVKSIAKSKDIKVLQPAKLTDIEDEIKAIDAPLGILVAYGKIIPKTVIDLFPRGIINVHPSLLPKYRGPAPVEAAILNADSETAVSLMHLTPGMDEGPVYVQKSVSLDGTEDRLGLNKKLSEIGAKMLVENLPGIIEGSLTPSPQDDSKATYTKLIHKEDGFTDWEEPADIIERKVRAFLGFPKVRGKIFDQDVVITKTRVAADEHDGRLVIKCAPGWLEVLEVIAPSGRTMSGADFTRGYDN